MKLINSNKYKIKETFFELYIQKKKITEIVSEIASRINIDYSFRFPLFVVTLKGAMFFAADLIRKVNLPCNIEAIFAKSYGNAMKNSGNVDVILNNINIVGRDVIVVEDIVDTGMTLHHLVNELSKLGANSIDVAALLIKPGSIKIPLNIKYSGIEVPDSFIIGYGLDYAEQGRELEDLYIESNE